MHLKRKPAALVVGIVIITLAACSTPVSPGMTADEVSSEVESMRAETTSVLADAGLTDIAATLGAVEPFSVPVGAGDLPRGVYQYDHGSGAWTLVGTSDDLDLNWEVEPTTGPDARLLVDWDASATTVERTLVDDSNVELPQGARVTLTVDGQQVSSLDQTASWPVNECGYLTEPGDFRVSGEATGDGAVLTIDDVGITVTAGATTANVESSGGADLDTSSGRAWLDWEARVDANVSRDPVTCEIVDGDVTSGRLAFDAGVEADGGTHSVGFATNFDIIEAPGTAHGYEIGLTGGRLTLGGQVAVTWTGVLDDENGNGVPGENLTLTFADATVTLEDFIVDHFFPFATVARVAAALR